ncbi:MAG: MBL fold metallo-hydrolase, partial [Bacteroidales bacterium]|nr:MBL fold metallo-hydrolase [Bacteroidales bacterium]
MEFTLKIMGSASAMPVVGRNQSAQVLDVHGRLFLLDSGEGVQTQLVRYRVPMQKIDSLFISHIHGDHVFGLFG